jgi:hypothetical protein
MRQHIDAIKKLFEADQPNKGPDRVEMTIPLFLRCLEWARESSPTDVDLHKFVENLIALNKFLGIEDYDELLKDINTPPEPGEEPKE